MANSLRRHRTPEAAVFRPKPSYSGRDFNRQDYADLFRHHKFTAAIRNYRLENVHLDTAAMISFKRAKGFGRQMGGGGGGNLDGDEFGEAGTGYFYYIMALGLLQITIIGWFSPYRQWIGPYEIYKAAETALLSGHLNPWQADMLALLGHDQITSGI